MPAPVRQQFLSDSAGLHNAARMENDLANVLSTVVTTIQLCD
jgi:hypothetical protein